MVERHKRATWSDEVVRIGWLITRAQEQPQTYYCWASCDIGPLTSGVNPCKHWLVNTVDSFLIICLSILHISFPTYNQDYYSRYKASIYDKHISIQIPSTPLLGSQRSPKKEEIKKKWFFSFSSILCNRCYSGSGVIEIDIGMVSSCLNVIYREY